MDQTVQGATVEELLEDWRWIERFVEENLIKIDDESNDHDQILIKLLELFIDRVLNHNLWFVAPSLNT